LHSSSFEHMRSLMHSIPGGQRPIVLPECNAWSLCVPWTRCLEAAGIRRNTWKKQRESCRALLSKCACSYDSYMFMLLLHIFCGRGKAQRICSWVSEQSFTLFGIQLEVFVLYHVTSLSLRVFWMALTAKGADAFSNCLVVVKVGRRMWLIFDFCEKLKRLQHGTTYDSSVLLGDHRCGWSCFSNFDCPAFLVLPQFGYSTCSVWSSLHDLTFMPSAFSKILHDFSAQRRPWRSSALRSVVPMGHRALFGREGHGRWAKYHRLLAKNILLNIITYTMYNNVTYRQIETKVEITWQKGIQTD